MSDPDLTRAAAIMAEATSSFVLPDYGLEGLEALVAAGWTITPPRSTFGGRRVPAEPGVDMSDPRDHGLLR